LPKGLITVDILQEIAEVHGNGSMYTVFYTVNLNGSKDKRMTRGQKHTIHGSGILIAGDDHRNGVLFVNEKTGDETPIGIRAIATNIEESVAVYVPMFLPPGSYSLYIVTQYDGTPNGLEKPIRFKVASKLRPSGAVPMKREC
jgi:hypothetical protein